MSEYQTFAIIASFVVAYSLVARGLERTPVSGPAGAHPHWGTPGRK